jgi:type I site-specific restriction endonuclease
VIDVETLTRLKAMRLSGMAEYFEKLSGTTGIGALTGPEMVKQAVDWEYERRRDNKLHRLRRQAGLAQPDADISDIKAMPGRDVDTELIARLAVGSYLVKYQDVVLQGPTGAGKTYVACALGNKACQQYRTVLYLSAGELFDRITIAERTDQKKRCLATLVKVDLLINVAVAQPQPERWLTTQRNSGSQSAQYPVSVQQHLTSAFARQKYLWEPGCFDWMLLVADPRERDLMAVQRLIAGRFTDLVDYFCAGLRGRCSVSRWESLGSTQHRAGIRSSKIIIVSTRAEAPIFGIADYSVVGGLFRVSPQLAEAIKARKG